MNALPTRRQTVPRRTALVLACRRAFTLAELLVVLAIVAILATVTVVAVGRISDDARLSTAVNTVTAGLDNARAFAIKRNKVIMAAFHVHYRTNRAQHTELVLAEWDGTSRPIDIGGRLLLIDRFVPLKDVAPRDLPEGIKVAGAWYDVFGADDLWVTQPEMKNTDPSSATAEYGGRLVTMIFAPDGSIVPFNPVSGNDDSYIDFNLDGEQQIGNTTGGSRFFIYDEVDDEPNAEAVPFLAVYDDRLAREQSVLDWHSEANYQAELSGPEGYITKLADRLHFNRYTGVMMR